MLRQSRSQVTGGGAVSVSTLGAPSKIKTYSLDEISKRADALALAVGTKVTASALMLAAVVVILLGAQSLLSALKSMDHDIKEMNEQLAVANGGLVILNKTMDSLPPTTGHLHNIVSTVNDMSSEVQTSSKSINSMANTTTQLNGKLSDIAGSTTSMRESLQDASQGAGKMSSTIDTLNSSIGPLVSTQHRMMLGTVKMRDGLDGMNASLAYTIRIMNYITAPPHGQGMTIRAEMPKQTLPPIPGIRAEVEPVPVFPRNIWPIYTGP